MSSIRVLSGPQVELLVKTLTAKALIVMLGRTMHAITADSRRSDPSGEVPPNQNPQRISTSTANHTMLYMPSRLTTTQNVSMTTIKVVAVPNPACPHLGLPGTTMLFDEQTGRAKAIVNAGELTGVRTAAASALATSLLASPTSTSLVLFGTGTQAYYHAHLIVQLFPTITSVVLISRQVTARATALAARLSEEHPQVSTHVRTAESTSEAVKNADIICCCVPSTAPVFTAEDLKPGVHINAIGSYKPTMQEFPPSLLSQDPSTPISIPTILVDSRDACLAEAGELIAAEIPPSSLLELGEVVDVLGEKIDGFEQLGLRRNGRSLFKCVGIGGMDVAISELVYEVAVGTGVGTLVPF